MTTALQSNQIGKIAAGVIIGLVVIGILLGLVITALLGRLIILILVVFAAAFVWQQRSSIENKINTDSCHLSGTFFGVHVKAPPDVVKACQKVRSK